MTHFISGIHLLHLHDLLVVAVLLKMHNECVSCVSPLAEHARRGDVGNLRRQTAINAETRTKMRDCFVNMEGAKLDGGDSDCDISSDEDSGEADAGLKDLASLLRHRQQQAPCVRLAGWPLAASGSSLRRLARINV